MVDSDPATVIADALGPAALRQQLTAAAFVEIVNTLVGAFDVIDVLTNLTTRCVELLEVSAAGILLADGDGQLRVIGASTEHIELLELFQIQQEQGPCLDCYNTGRVVVSSDLNDTSPWPLFGPESVRLGFPSVWAVPLRLRDVVLGCLNLFMPKPNEPSAADIDLAQALADVASIAIIQNRTTREAIVREGHLQHALNSRVVIEQAKGMIAERAGVGVEEAFARLRAYARSNNRGLTQVATAIVSGALSVRTFANR